MSEIYEVFIRSSFFKYIFMTASKSKKVKLQPKHLALVYGQKIVPSLKISGVWLEELGVKAGDMVSITTREQLLIIEPLGYGDQRD